MLIFVTAVKENFQYFQWRWVYMWWPSEYIKDKARPNFFYLDYTVGKRFKDSVSNTWNALYY